MMTPKSLRLFLIFSIFSVLYMLSMFYRVSNAVIAPNLIRDLGLNAETLGILGGAFFYAFALLQIPMGPMLDRIGPRIIVTSSLLIGASGAFIFAISNSFTGALWGRILIGVGMASILMGALKVFILRFPPEKFATFVGIVYSVGTLGNIVAASPLAYLASTIGWRITFILAGGITATLAFLVFWVLGGEKRQEATSTRPPPPEPPIGILPSIRLVLGSLAFWQIGAISFFRFGTLISLQGLWLGPYLIDIEGYSPVQTGNLLILLAIGAIIGGPISGRLSDQIFQSRKGVALWGLSLYALTLFPLIGVLKFQGPLWYGLLFFFMGFFHSFGLLLFAHIKELFPVTISGTVTAWTNFFNMAGGALFMPALGKVIESFHKTGSSYPAEAYHLSFLICFLSMAASVIFYAFLKKAYS